MSLSELTKADAGYDRAYPWVVKSLRQSQLLESWLRQLGTDGALPALDGFNALRSYREQDELTIYNVVADNETWRYMIANESAAFRSLFHQSRKGRFLDETVSATAWRTLRVSLNECVRQALPVYTVSSIEDDDGEKVMYERLLLPFGSGGSAVTSIATSLKRTSWDGSSDPKPVARSNGHHLEYSFRAVIALD